MEKSTYEQLREYYDSTYGTWMIDRDPKEVDISSYKSIADAASDLGINGSSISMCCKGKLKTTGKHIFKYK